MSLSPDHLIYFWYSGTQEYDSTSKNSSFFKTFKHYYPGQVDCHFVLVEKFVVLAGLLKGNQLVSNLDTHRNQILNPQNHCAGSMVSQS